MQLRLGTIVNTHGIRGELKVLPSTDFIEDRFAVGSEVLLHYGKEVRCFVIDSFRMHKGCVLITFEGLHDINKVEKYKGLELFVESEGSEDEDFYYFELIDCEVYYGNEYIGKVSEIIETQAHEILRVTCEHRKDVLIPYVERFIKDVDSEKKRIEIDVIEGML